MRQEKADYVISKKIHFDTIIPSVTVKMMDNECEVGTEFDRLKPLKAWYCNMCTAENHDINGEKCSFCKNIRNYKEKISIKDEAEKTVETKQNKNDNIKEMESLQIKESDNGQGIKSNIEQSPHSALSDDEESEQEGDDMDDDDDNYYYPSFNRPFYNQSRPKPIYRNRARRPFYSTFN
eukprot:80325_1